MKKTVLIQSTPHWPTAWGDSLQAWNVASIFSFPSTHIIRDYRQQLGFWTKNSFNIILDVDKQDANYIKLGHFFTQKNSSDMMTKRIDIRDAIAYLDNDPQVRTCALGTFFDDSEVGSSQMNMISNARFFARAPHPVIANTPEKLEEYLDSKFFYLDNPAEERNPTSGRVNCLCWFFMYKAVDLPIYYIIPNPDLLGIDSNIDQSSNDDIRYMGIDAHFGSVGDIIFRPGFSSNVKELSPTKIVAGDKFHIVPFEKGVFGFAYNEVVPKVSVKVHTNLNFVRDPETNKVTFEFKEGQDQGYVHLRWNSATIMDITQSSRSLDLIENKCKVTFDVYKDSRYKYSED
jgi:hypothetical protein